MSTKSTPERLQAQVFKAQALAERQQSADNAKAEHRTALLARDQKTERLKAQRLAAAAEAVAAIPVAAEKRKARVLRPGQTPKTRRAING